MLLKLKERGLGTPKLVITVLLFLSALLSLIPVVTGEGDAFSYIYCFITALFVLLPPVLTLLLRWEMHFGFYLVFSLYTMGPLLGAVYKLYYVTSWWDILLHALAGFLFAVVGAHLATALNKGREPSYALAIVFGLLVSLGVAALWEFFEYGADIVLGSDMQTDTVIHSFVTKLGGVNGGVVRYEGIADTLVNGQSLGQGGYIDIGLIDTMSDMLYEAIGAIGYAVYALFDRGRHPLIKHLKR
ncbi:MAG: hypothetical protein IJC99_02010 [Clostridia bacterium]|nr:hypothetical protein [Clostridia bacterium]